MSGSMRVISSLEIRLRYVELTAHAQGEVMSETLPSGFKGRRIADIPAGNDSFMCVALVKSNSSLAREWNLGKPAFCIYEYTSWSSNKHEIRWGDGSGQDLDPEDFDSIILMREFGEPELDFLLN